MERKLINAGVYVIEPEILKFIPQGYSDFVQDIFPNLLKIKDLYGFQSKCYFKEIGQKIRFLKAKQSKRLI